MKWWIWSIGKSMGFREKSRGSDSFLLDVQVHKVKSYTGSLNRRKILSSVMNSVKDLFFLLTQNSTQCAWADLILWSIHPWVRRCMQVHLLLPQSWRWASDWQCCWSQTNTWDVLLFAGLSVFTPSDTELQVWPFSHRWQSASGQEL